MTGTWYLDLLGYGIAAGGGTGLGWVLRGIWQEERPSSRKARTEAALADARHERLLLHNARRTAKVRDGSTSATVRRADIRTSSNLRATPKTSVEKVSRKLG